MAQNVTTAFVTLFESEVKQAYQAESVLRGTMRTRTGVSGNTVKFPKIGKGVATVRVPQTDVTPLNVTYSQVTATMSDYIAAEYSDIFHQSHINFDERRELVEVVSKSIARRMDQLCIDALNASGGTGVGTNVGGTASNMNIEKIRATAKVMNTNNVPTGDRYLLIHASQCWAKLRSHRKTTQLLRLWFAARSIRLWALPSKRSVIVMKVACQYQAHALALPGTKTQWAMLNQWHKNQK
jgi:hypothetical protein